MALTDDEKLDILVARLAKVKYAMDEKERYHLLSLIRRGEIVITKEKTDDVE